MWPIHYGHLKCLASRGVDNYFLWGIYCCSRTCVAFVITPLDFFVCDLPYGELIIIITHMCHLQYHPHVLCVCALSFMELIIIVTIHDIYDNTCDFLCVCALCYGVLISCRAQVKNE